jgi:hypothetical protein
MSFATARETNAGVVALRDDVRQAIVDVELDLDVGIARQELRQCRPEDGFGRVLAAGDADGARRLVPEFA